MTAKRKKSLVKLDKIAIVLGSLNLFVTALIFKYDGHTDTKYLFVFVSIICLGLIYNSVKDIQRTSKVKVHS